ncbi:MAG: arylsulfatase [Chloroflexota bacterium]
MTQSEPAFAGVIGRTFAESKPSWIQPPRAAPDAPNVVYIVLDDVGYADLGCYGSEIATPAMDGLAARGLRYTGFHTTAQCSPTRASLLTGRNHHAVGMGVIPEWSTGFPGYRGQVTRRAANLAEILRDHGYNTFSAGKWHLVPGTDTTAAGPFDSWPTQRGFDRWYGFQGALTDQWNPELFMGTDPIERPSGDDYHLSEDIVDRSIGFIRDQQSAAPGKPFFLYLAFGACHWPHHVPASYIANYRGKFDRGWDVLREERLARQKAMGIVPPGTDLAPRTPGVPAWDEQSADERRFFARTQEVYAGFLEHTDAQIGRLLEFLDEMELTENTLIVLISDNGTSDEGANSGATNMRRLIYTREPEPLADRLAAMDSLGGPESYGHYPVGWAQLGNTPLKWFKKDVHGGGSRDPLIIHWPARIREGGALRHQYHHVIDVTPTVLDLLGIEAPTVYNGVAQMPMHGVSLAYTFEEPRAPTRRPVQHYEMCGDRGIWHGGWKAVTYHQKGVPFDQDHWELYQLDADYSECHDVSAQHPRKLEEMIERWWAEAGAYNVLPLDDREAERVRDVIASRSRKRNVYYPGMSRIDRVMTPDVTNRSYEISAEAVVPDGGMEGVLLTVGSLFGGYTLYGLGGHLVYEYNYGAGERYVVRSRQPVSPGQRVLAVRFTKTGQHRGMARLVVDGEPVGEGEISRTWPVTVATAGLTCGYATGTPVSASYACPFRFNGKLRRVVVELGDDAVRDYQAEFAVALAEE